MQNIDKPPASTEAKLNIGSAFNLLIGGIYDLVVGAAGGAGMTNKSKVSIGETWDTIATTWATESRTWLAASQLITNSALSTTDPLWSYRTFPWTMALPWQDTDSGITNESKP